MDQSKILIDSFHKTAAGRVITGKEAFRNRMGCILHGLTYKHSKSMIAIGVLSFIASGFAPVMLPATAPLMFMGVYSTISPKSTEKAACEFLVNVAIRKTDALARFLKRQHTPDEITQTTLQQYLKQNLPMGMAKEYITTHPEAITQIQSGHAIEACYHTPGVYLLEAVQEQLTQSKDKGGILHGFIQNITPQFRSLQERAQQIATTRWHNRQLWEKMPSPKSTWTSFMRETEHPKQNQSKLPSALAHWKTASKTRASRIKNPTKNKLNNVTLSADTSR